MLRNHVEILGLVAGSCTALSLLPQLIKLARTRKSEDISLFYLVMLLTGLGLWIWYGVMRNDTPIIATNSLALILNIAIIIMGIRYRKSHL